MTDKNTHLLRKKFGVIEGAHDGLVETKTGTTLGALSVEAELTLVNTTGAATATLAKGKRVGQKKRVLIVAHAGNLVLTPANFANGTTITFSAANKFLNLVWNGTNWANTGTDATIA